MARPWTSCGQISDFAIVDVTISELAVSLSCHDITDVDYVVIAYNNLPIAYQK